MTKAYQGQGQKINGKIKFRHCDGLAYDVYLENFKDGDWFNIKVSKATKPKSSGQLGFYYGVIIPTAIQALTATGNVKLIMGVPVPYDDKDADTLLKHFCGRVTPDDQVVMYEINKTDKLPMISKSDASKDQMNQYTNNCKAWLNNTHNCSL